MGKLTSSKPKLVWVRWVDPHTSSGWEELADLDPAGYAESCGFLVKQENGNIFLALNLDFVNDNVNCYIAIPKVLIKSIHELTLLEGDNAYETCEERQSEA